MTDIFEPFWTEDFKKIIEQNRQVHEQLKKKRVKKDFIKEISNIHNREIRISSQLIANSGDIILRPLKNLKSDLNLDLNHYGIALGTTIAYKRLVLEINPDNDVGIVSWEKFLGGHIIKNVDVKRKPDNTSFESIIKRAEELQHETYSLTNLNCGQFVNYCVYEKRESDAVQQISSLVTPFLDTVSAYMDYKAGFQNKKDKKMLIEFSSKIKGVSNNIKKLK